MADLSHAYFSPADDGGGNWINPYDPGGGYVSQTSAEAAAQASGGRMTYRQPSPSGILGSGLTTSDVIGMASFVGAPWLGAPDVGGPAGGLLPLEEAGGSVITAESAAAAGIPASAANPLFAPGGAAPAGGAAPITMLDATTPTVPVSPETMALLGINADPVFGGPAFQSAGGTMAGGAPTFGENAFGGGYLGEPTGQYGGPTGMEAGAGAGPLDATTAWLKKLGLTPATAGLLGISGLQALSKPKLPQAAQDLQKTATAGGAAASGVIQSGGTSGPAWATQKASIDATIDQQLKEQTAAMMQQAVNSGVGADSQVTQQQINKLKNQLETSRQQMYAQAQAQNVQAALQELGISDQALAQVANTQFQQSAQARQGAAQTASLALMLATLGKA